MTDRELIDKKIDEYSEAFDFYMDCGKMPENIPPDDLLGGYMAQVIDDNPQLSPEEPIWNEVLKDSLLSYFNVLLQHFLEIERQRQKLETNLGSIADLTRLPSAIFVVDVMKEHIAVAEAVRLGIPVFAMVDTNSNPRNIDYVIPANDDATKSVEVVLGALCDAIAEGLEERKVEKADQDAAEASGKAPRKKAAKAEEAEAPAEEA